MSGGCVGQDTQEGIIEEMGYMLTVSLWERNYGVLLENMASNLIL